MAKQTIRHLEFYGFPDQNAFTKEGWSNPADGRQDHAIHELFHRTHMLKDWNIKQEKDIEKLTDEYNNVAETVIEHESDIETINGNISTINTNIDTMSETVSAISADVATINSNVSSISGDVEDIKEQIGSSSSTTKEQIDELSGKVEDNHTEFLDYSATTAQYLKDYSEWVDLRYAHQDNTYTKDEVDDLLSGLSSYATEEWVISQNYLTEASGNSIYVRQDAFNPYSASTQLVLEGLETSARTLANNIHVLDEKVDDYHTQVENYITKTNALEDDVDALDARVGNNEVKIESINTALSGKVNTSTFENAIERLDGRIDNLSSSTDTKLAALDAKKVDNTVYTGFTSSTRSTIEQINDNIRALNFEKATKTDLTAEISARTSADSVLSGAITTEKSRAEGVENTLDGKITTEKNRAEGIEQGLRNDLDNEITRATNAENSLIGESGDDFSKITIYGARAEALRLYNKAIESANTYADSAASEMGSEISAVFAEKYDNALEQKADKNYVDGKVSDAVDTIDRTIEDLSGKIVNNYDVLDTRITKEIADRQEQYSGISNAVSSATTRINAITAWEGENPDEYVNTGNGVLDVLHRELHALIDTLTQKGILP